MQFKQNCDYLRKGISHLIQCTAIVLPVWYSSVFVYMFAFSTQFVKPLRNTIWEQIFILIFLFTFLKSYWEAGSFTPILFYWSWIDGRTARRTLVLLPHGNTIKFIIMKKEEQNKSTTQCLWCIGFQQLYNENPRVECL